MIDRGRDARDVFTFTLGEGMGVKARVGPFQSGLLVQRDAWGLRGGGSPGGRGASPRDDVSPIPDTLDLQLIVLGNDAFPTGVPLVQDRHKSYEALTVAFFSTVKPKCGRVPSYYTAIEAVAALGGSVRLGFNPGELLDFVLGWFGLDLYRDDLAIAAWKCGAP